ncbi:hypothetical protein PHYBLDRAFT_149727 [Phycomyces blakesleeanus NRRL 1555(-)]|uniref:4Fe-4S Mo/W bis-MGD-type domain-containing protein n=1 Tax=Phycomyces blakesleeanus (strain ATCC 8743b / DSM 1359 / FGSC 10004 / NBRC 33097 / NRRL 1555) TaxID=763407 RepID=A0A162TKL9_PHYB8|nr:hypothetical protein PHYBLDRAFT_149727 [Phycomyces blakesleeanus NRRL 1555(-)]OAD69332.1 hypothetical protein PHYBLDRAFT_149727 [Phycomyces blakesleeanus NRRL 1555(-)]|eukprot:XP_018287372.1 hypothetical protein PHYBLDRAFT_149727 [Phycomyces blakesleeanus NRRL 1555(-)]
MPKWFRDLWGTKRQECGRHALKYSHKAHYFHDHFKTGCVFDVGSDADTDASTKANTNTTISTSTNNSNPGPVSRATTELLSCTDIRYTKTQCGTQCWGPCLVNSGVNISGRIGIVQPTSQPTSQPANQPTN